MCVTGSGNERKGRDGRPLQPRRIVVVIVLRAHVVCGDQVVAAAVAAAAAAPVVIASAIIASRARESDSPASGRRPVSPRSVVKFEFRFSTADHRTNTITAPSLYINNIIFMYTNLRRRRGRKRADYRVVCSAGNST